MFDGGTIQLIPCTTRWVDVSDQVPGWRITSQGNNVCSATPSRTYYYAMTKNVFLEILCLTSPWSFWSADDDIQVVYLN